MQASPYIVLAKIGVVAVVCWMTLWCFGLTGEVSSFVKGNFAVLLAIGHLVAIALASMLGHFKLTLILILTGSLTLWYGGMI